MSFVVDASIAGSWLMPDERSAAATQLGRRMLAEGAVALDLFRHEIRNLLVMAVQRGRMPEDLLWAQLARFENMPIRLAPAGPSARIAQRALTHRLTQRALTHRLTAYDAAYLDLALDQALPL